MRAKDIMTKKVATAAPDTTVVEIAKMLVENDCGAIPVLADDESGRPVGIVTDRDIVVRVVATSVDPEECTANDFMSAPAVTVSDDATLQDCASLMETAQIRRLVVVDESGRCCGVVSQADIAREGADVAGEVVHEVSKPAGGVDPGITRSGSPEGRPSASR